MSDPSAFLSLIEENSRQLSDDDRRGFSHRHMLALADMLIGWSLDGRLGPGRIRTLLDQAEHWERVAAEVGADWNPPEPQHLSFLHLIARFTLREALGDKPSKEP